MISKETKINFIYNSNLIENIDMPAYEYPDLNKSKIHEIKGHSLAFDYMIKNYKKKLSHRHIKEMHRLLTTGLLPPDKSGNYRTGNVYIAGHMGRLPIFIKPGMNKLFKDANEILTEDECWDMHHRFEVIHPFVDGNGRIGRLLLNWLLLKNGFDFCIIYIKDRWNYYNKIEKYRTGKRILETYVWDEPKK